MSPPPISYPEGHFNILSSPDLHLFIITPNVIEIIFRDREQSSSECWCSVQYRKKMYISRFVSKSKQIELKGCSLQNCPSVLICLQCLICLIHVLCVLLDGVGLIFATFFFMIRQTLPAEGQAPVKVAPIVVLPIWRRLHELKCVQVNSGDVWTHHCCVVLCDPGQQRLQPAMKTLTCTRRAFKRVVYCCCGKSRNCGSRMSKLQALRGGEVWVQTKQTFQEQQCRASYLQGTGALENL